MIATFSLAVPDNALTFTTRDDGGFGTLLLTSAATRTWNGGSALWHDATQWTTSGSAPSSAPLAGDTVFINGGTAELGANLGPLQATQLHLNGTKTNAATVQLDGVTIGYTSSIVVDGFAHGGRVNLVGANELDGTAKASSENGVLTFGLPDAANPASLTIVGAVVAGTGAAVRFAGMPVVNNGLIDSYGRIDFAANAPLLGEGVVEVNHGGVVLFGGAADSQQQVTFDDTTGRLVIGDLAQFSGQIQQFQQGDVIDLQNTTVTAGSFNSGTLTLMDGTHDGGHADRQLWIERRGRERGPRILIGRRQRNEYRLPDDRTRPARRLDARGRSGRSYGHGLVPRHPDAGVRNHPGGIYELYALSDAHEPAQ